MELRLFSCLSFLWPEKDPSKCDGRADGSAAPGPDSCSWEHLAPLLRRINDPAELRRVVLHCLGDGGIPGQIPLSRLLLPFKLHSAADDGGGECGGDREEDAVEEDERLVAVDDVVAAVTEADTQGCARSLISAFEFFDRDGDGVISAADLTLALRDVVRGEGDQLGEREAPSAAACEEMVAAFDWERVGGVCFADFIRMMVGPDGDHCRPSGRRPPDLDHARILKRAHL